MANDNKKPGNDVRSLFSSLGLDPTRYQHSTQARKSEEAAQAAESRWPLLGEMRASFAASRDSDPMEAAPKPEVDAQDATPEPRHWNLLEELAAQAQDDKADPGALPQDAYAAEPEPEPEPGHAEELRPQTESGYESDQAASAAPQRDRPLLTETGPTLEEVFGPRSNERQTHMPTGESAGLTEHEKPRGDNLQSLFTRLRGGADTQPQPAGIQPKGLGDIFDRLRRKDRD